MLQVIGLGAGGHAKVVIEILRHIGGYEIVGLLDAKRQLWNTMVLDVPVLGDDTLLVELHNRGVSSTFIGLGTVRDTRPRQQLYETACQHGLQVVPAIHPQAVVAPSAKIGEGPTIMAGAIIGTDVRLGNNVIVNTGAIIEHDCVIGDHTHIATGSRLGGTVCVEAGTHIGLGASVRQCIHIGRNVIVGAGAVVVDDVPDHVVVVGVPARVLRSLVAE